MNKHSKYRPLMDEIQGQIMRAEIGVTGLYQIMLETLDEAEKEHKDELESVRKMADLRSERFDKLLEIFGRMDEEHLLKVTTIEELLKV